MDFILGWISEHFHQETAVITGAPGYFIGLVIISMLACYFYVRHGFAHRFESQDIRATAQQARIEQLQGLVDEYKDRLHGATPMEVQEKIASLEGEVDSMKARLDAPARTVTEDQRAKLAAAIAAEPLEVRKTRFHIRSATDEEAIRYAVRLCRAFKDAGGLLLYQQHGLSDEGEYGLFISVRDPDQLSEDAKILERLLTAAEIPFTVAKHDGTGDLDCYLFVAFNPGTAKQSSALLPQLPQSTGSKTQQ